VLASARMVNAARIVMLCWSHLELFRCVGHSQDGNAELVTARVVMLCWSQLEL